MGHGMKTDILFSTADYGIDFTLRGDKRMSGEVRDKRWSREGMDKRRSMENIGKRSSGDSMDRRRSIDSIGKQFSDEGMDKYAHYSSIGEHTFAHMHTVTPEQQSSPDIHKTFAYSASFSDQHSSDSTKEQKIRRAFGCGCGRCSLTTFLDKGCPEPVKSLSSFPYLQTQGLNHGEVMILKGRLYNEFQLMTRAFSKFNFSICMSLIYREVPVKMLARVLRDLRAFQPSECDSPLLRDRFEAIKGAEDIDEVFDILAEYVSFFSFHITEHIVESLGTKEDKKLLADYKGELEEYCKRNIFECPSYSTPKPGVADLVMKVEGIERYNLKHLAELISHVSKVLSVSQHTLQLCSVEKGCVQLNFQIPHFVKDKIFPLTTEQKRAFEKKEIISVRCEGWTYKVSFI